jgi:hypothetical protein
MTPVALMKHTSRGSFQTLDHKMNNNLKQKRPLVLSIICWLIIVVSVLAILRNILTLALGFFVPEMATVLQTSVSRWEIPGWVIYVQSSVVRVLFLAAAIAMLKQKNWGRIFVFVLILFSFAFYIALVGFIPKLVFKAIISAIYIGMLLLPAVNQFFRGVDQAKRENEETPTIASTLSPAPPVQSDAGRSYG